MSSDDANRHAALESGREAIMPMLEADGFDVRLTTTHTTEVTARIVATDAACADCLVPATVLESIILKELRRHDPTIECVIVSQDPTVSPSA